jgi:arylsulfatase A-like enzyme
MTALGSDVTPTAATMQPVHCLRSFLVAGLWLGLAYGLAEAAEFCLLGLVPGALAWRSGNALPIVWVAPVVYAFVGLALAMLFWALTLATRRVDGMKVFVFVMLVGGAYLGARLQGQIIAAWASLILALGIGVQLTRVFARRREQMLSMMRRTLLPLGGVVGALAIIQPMASAALERQALNRVPAGGSGPNVLVLVADTLRADHLSGNGYARPTARIDRLAAEGASFVDAYSASSWTLPAHASLMTGRRMHEHRAGRESHPFLDKQFPTLAEILGRAGYVSGGFVANTFWCGRQTGLDRGFVHYEDFYTKLGDALARTVLGRLLVYEALPHLGELDIPGRKSAADINDHLLRWIDGLGGRPFFVFANYMDVHGPYIPPPDYDGRYAGSKLDRRLGSEIELGALNEDTRVPDPATLRASIDRYDESLFYLDEQIGRLLDELARRGLLDRTIVVFTSDHGENFGEHDLIYHGHSLYQEQIRIPLIVRYPSRIRGGARESRPIGLEEIPSLLVELAGVTENPFPRYSSSPGQAADPDNVAVSEVGRRRGVPDTWPTATGGLASVQTERWQLIVNDSGTAELYDLATDPKQANNLAQDSAHADTLAKLRVRLSKEVPEATREPPRRH